MPTYERKRSGEYTPYQPGKMVVTPIDIQVALAVVDATCPMPESAEALRIQNDVIIINNILEALVR